jgi:DNA-binding NarL/FixJ family response regulator
MLNILIACDHKASREALIRLLVAQPLFHVIAVCADTHAAINMTGNAQPDIVFIDGSTDPLAAIEATKKIRSFSTAGIIAVSRQEDAGFAAHMLAAGALGYLTSRSSDIEVITAVEEVAKDNLYCCLEARPLPVPTPEPVSSLKKTIASLRNNTRRRINEAAGTHWHGILKFTN